MTDGPYFTRGGRHSMDPAKWNVMRFEFAEEWQGKKIGPSLMMWAVFPPEAKMPMELMFTHQDAINKASRLAMFAVVPPEDMVAEVLRDNTIGEEDK